MSDWYLTYHRREKQKILKIVLNGNIMLLRICSRYEKTQNTKKEVLTWKLQR